MDTHLLFDQSQWVLFAAGDLHGGLEESLGSPMPRRVAERIDDAVRSSFTSLTSGRRVEQRRS